jgi:diaminobutyrate-2-oxoglutarate transaminase
MPYDGYMGDEMDTIAFLERMLADRSSGLDMPAAVILETVQGEGGLNTASLPWLQRLQALCKKRDIVFIVDEIQTGCGRTGTFFSFEPAGIKPDMVTLSKSLSGYGLPFSVVLINRALDKWKPAEHNGTFRGNNHAFVTATAMLRHYWATPDFAKEVVEKGKYLGQRLQTMVERFSPDLIQVKGRGMMQGLLCADPKRAAAITANAFRHGLIIERAGPEDEVIKCLMPLTTSYDILNEGLDILENAIAEECGRTGRTAIAAESLGTDRKSRTVKKLPAVAAPCVPVSAQSLVQPVLEQRMMANPVQTVMLYGSMTFAPILPADKRRKPAR